MANRRDDDLAAALAKLQRGEIEVGDDETSEGDAAEARGDFVDLGAPPPPPLAKPVPAPPPNLAAARAAAAAQRVAPAPREAAAAKVAPVAPIAAVPRVQSAPPRAVDRKPPPAAAAPVRPMEMPPRPMQLTGGADVAMADVDPPIVDEDDATLVPAASDEYLARPAAPRPAAPRADRALERRRTLIPILLTLGVLLPLLGIMRWIVDAASPLGSMPGWLAGLLIGGGVALLGLAGLNMALVQRTAAAPALQDELRERAAGSIV